MNKDLSIIAQNAGSTAAVVFSALVQARVVEEETTADYLDIYDDIRQRVFEGSLSLAGAGGGPVVTSVGGVAEATATVQAAFPGATVESNTNVRSSGAGGGRPRGDLVVNFGKHRGKTLDQIADEDPDYLDWAKDNLNNDFVKKAVREYLAA